MLQDFAIIKKNRNHPALWAYIQHINKIIDTGNITEILKRAS